MDKRDFHPHQKGCDCDCSWRKHQHFHTEVPDRSRLNGKTKIEDQAIKERLANYRR